jgi:hypothetical protein
MTQPAAARIHTAATRNPTSPTARTGFAARALAAAGADSDDDPYDFWDDDPYDEDEE